MSAEEFALQIADLEVGYADQLVLQGLALTVAQREVVAVMGASGCGKTTLVRAVAGLIDVRRGTIDVSSDGMSRPVVMFQSPLLLPWLTVRKNVALPCAIGGEAGDVEAVLDAVGLSGHEQRYSWQLSGGQRRRVALARALITKPGLLLLDEPFTGVDELTRERLVSLLAALIDSRGIACLFITHSVTEAVHLADRVIVLDGAPAGIRSCFEVNLPGARKDRNRLTHAFADEAARLRQIIGTDEC